MSILAGARKGKKGSILVDGKSFFKDHPVAYVPQENPLVEELSVRDNLLLWYKGDRKKDGKRPGRWSGCHFRHFTDVKKRQQGSYQEV